MAEYGLKVNDINGRRIFDTTRRSWEAVAWGTLNLVANTPAKVDIPANCEMPMVFTRYVGGSGFLIRGRNTQASGYQYFLSSVTRDVPYVVAALRTDGNAGNGYGLACFDALGRCTFSTSRAYVRPNFPTNLYSAWNWTNDVQSVWRLDTTGTGTPAAFSANTYMWHGPGYTWENGGSDLWVMGSIYGFYSPGNFDAISMQRISIPKTLGAAPYYLGNTWVAGGPGPGVTSQLPIPRPRIFDFFPPA